MEENKTLRLISVCGFAIFAAVSCWATAESLHLLLPSWPIFMCWAVTIGFFVIASIGTKLIVDSFPQDEKLIFGPDKNLGGYINSVTGRNMVLWDGACHVHEEFSLEKILELKKEHPEAKVVVHPECKATVAAVADYVGSTAGILDYCGNSEASEFIVVTESGILSEMRRKYPQKSFIPAPPIDSTCACNECRYMKMVTLENIISCLENESPEIVLDEDTRKAAERSILNMISI